MLQTYRPNYLCILLICLSYLVRVFCRLTQWLCGWSCHAKRKHIFLFLSLGLHLEECVLWFPSLLLVFLQDVRKGGLSWCISFLQMHSQNIYIITQAVNDLSSFLKKVIPHPEILRSFTRFHRRSLSWLKSWFSWFSYIPNQLCKGLRNYDLFELLHRLSHFLSLMEL